MDVLWSVVLLLALAGLSLLAYALRILDGPGAGASFVLGLVVVFSGGLGWLVLMAAFTGLGFVATRLGDRHKQRRGLAEPREGERSVWNVVGNGAAPGLAALSVTFMEPLAAQLAFTAAVAAAAADTLASEVGGLSMRARLSVPPFDRRPAGENGAVSWLGQAAALLGAAFIAAAGALLLGFPPAWAWLPTVAGFLGSQIDSVLGATLERDYMRPERPLGKQDVNFIAAFVPALAVLITVQLA